MEQLKSLLAQLQNDLSKYEEEAKTASFKVKTTIAQIKKVTKMIEEWK